MWMTIFEVAIKLLGYFLDKNKVSTETAKNFYAFVKSAGDDMGSVKLKAYSQKQLLWLKENPWP